MPDALDAFEAYWAQLAARKQRLIALLNARPVPDDLPQTITYAEVKAIAGGEALAG